MWCCILFYIRYISIFTLISILYVSFCWWWCANDLILIIFKSKTQVRKEVRKEQSNKANVNSSTVSEPSLKASSFQVRLCVVPILSRTVVSLPGYSCGLMFYTVTVLNYCSLLELTDLLVLFAVDDWRHWWCCSNTTSEGQFRV